MSTPEVRLWANLRKAAPKKTWAFRIENRSGPGTPDVAVVWRSVTAWVELKAPKSASVIHSETLNIRPYLFGFSEEFWSDAMLNKYTSQDLIGLSPADHFQLRFANPKYVRSTQAAWHAKVFSVGALSFFLEKTPGPSFYRLLSPYLCHDSGTLRLGLVCETKDVALMWYALRLCAEMHSLAALRLDP